MEQRRAIWRQITSIDPLITADRREFMGQGEIQQVKIFSLIEPANSAVLAAGMP